MTVQGETQMGLKTAFAAGALAALATKPLTLDSCLSCSLYHTTIHFYIHIARPATAWKPR